MAALAHRLSPAPAARRALTEAPPAGLPMAAAVGEFITGPLPDRPRTVGKPLARELAAITAPRRGAYRVIYRIDDRTRTVHVVRIDHRAHACHP